MQKRKARAAAKLYVAEMFRADDQPGWLEYFFPADSDEATEFMDELGRIADRLYRQVPQSLIDEYNAKRRR